MRYIQDPVTLELVPADQYRPPNETFHYVRGDLQPFVSPIDQTVISDHGQLREHMRRHNVTHASDYTPEFIQKKKREREAELQSGNRERKRQLYNAWNGLERGELKRADT